MIWKKEVSIAFLNDLSKGNMVGHLGIELLEVGPDFIRARMPVDERTRQAVGLLHGGASAALSESMGSFASVLMVDDIAVTPVVGIEINANHLKSVRSGFVYATTRPIRIGKKIHVWETHIRDEASDLVCVSRLTVMVLDAKK